MENQGQTSAFECTSETLVTLNREYPFLAPLVTIKYDGRYKSDSVAKEHT